MYLEVGDWDTVVARRDFYASVLGLGIRSELEGESVWFEAGAGTFGFHTGDGPPREERAAINLVFDVGSDTSIDEEAARITALGVELAMEPTDMPWGRRVVTFLDPAGHAVWYCQRL